MQSDSIIDDFKSQIQYFERRLCERAERYTNAGLGTGVGTEWRPLVLLRKPRTRDSALKQMIEVPNYST